MILDGYPPGFIGKNGGEQVTPTHKSVGISTNIV